MSEEKRATKIALFNHKGGVSKTTTTFNLAWKLAEQGHKVVMVDADPQCNLTGMILGYRGITELEQFYTETEAYGTIKTGLEPAFSALPKAIEPVPLMELPQRAGLHLLMGDLRLSEYENTLGIAQELSGAIQTLKNLPGSFSYLVDITAESVDADFVLIDMSPGLGPVNQNLVMTSDCLIVPTAPDFFSVMALDSLSRVLPDWKRWAVQAASLEVLSSAPYPFPRPRLRIMGTIIQKYRPRSGSPAVSFQNWIDEIDRAMEEKFLPSMQRADLLFDANCYKEAGLDKTLNLAQIPEFNSLIAKSHEHSTPVFALSDDQLQGGGQVMANWRKSRDIFNGQFDDLARRVVSIARHSSANASA